MIRRPIEYEVSVDGCHICTSHARNHKGYTRITVGGKDLKMHRYLYEQTHGEIPKDLVVRHKCDNPSCINLAHLELGTHQDNVNDKMQRGRHVGTSSPGEKNPNSVLTEHIVREIRADKSSTNVALGKKYNVTHQLISKIRKGYIWSHVS